MMSPDDDQRLMLWIRRSLAAAGFEVRPVRRGPLGDVLELPDRMWAVIRVGVAAPAAIFSFENDAKEWAAENFAGLAYSIREVRP